MGECEHECTDNDYCVGFSFGNVCTIFPSRKSCPSTWDIDMSETGHVASKGSDLAEGDLPGYTCTIKEGVKLIKCS